MNSQTAQQWKRFKSIKRGYYSLIAMLVFLALSIFAELLINNRAILVKYDGNYYFPTYAGFIAGTHFGLDYAYETNYRDLKKHFSGQNENWVLLPPIPYSPFETNFLENSFPPYPPSINDQHYLGTDIAGRDIFSRLAYGFRLAITFSIILLACNYFL